MTKVFENQNFNGYYEKQKKVINLYIESLKTAFSKSYLQGFSAKNYAYTLFIRTILQ